MLYTRGEHQTQTQEEVNRITLNYLQNASVKEKRECRMCFLGNAFSGWILS